MGADAIEMFEEIVALQWWECESGIGKHRALGWIEVVLFEVIACDVDVSLLWGWEGGVAKYLCMESARQQLHSDFITLG